MKKNIIIGALLLIIGAVAGALLCRTFHHPSEVEVVQTDTLVYRDTIREYYPVEINKEVVRTEYVIVRDTMRIKDTLYLSLPFERRVYGNDEFYAEVTGYKPSLDYIEVFPKTTTIKESVTQTVAYRHALGLGLDMDYTNTVSIPIYLEYSYLLHKNIEFSARLLYDIPSQTYGAGVGLKMQIGW